MEARVRKSEIPVRAGPCCLPRLRGGSSFLLQGPGGPGVPGWWLQTPTSVSMVPGLGFCVTFSPLPRTPGPGFGVHSESKMMTSQEPSLDPSAETLFPTKVPFSGSAVSTQTHLFGATTQSSQMGRKEPRPPPASLAGRCTTVPGSGWKRERAGLAGPPLPRCRPRGQRSKPRNGHWALL